MTDDPRLGRMGSFDAVMWGVEADPLLRSVIVAMAVLDSEPDMDVLVDRIDRMTLVTPKLRKRVIGNPVSLVPPRWELDPNFDLSYHVRRYHLPADGTDGPLMRIAEQLGEQDFDRNRPLWEMAVVHGFDGERTAVITKVHHAIADGVGGMAMLASLFDLTRTPAKGGDDEDYGDLGGEPLGAWGRLINGAEFATKSVVSKSLSAVGAATGAAVHTVTSPAAAVNDTAAFAQSAARLLAPASEPLSPLMQGRSLGVRMIVLSMPFAALRGAAKAADATINDTYMAAVAGGIAAYHEAQNAPAEAIRVNMPVNVRKEGDEAANRWVPARFVLPIDSGDPIDRIHRYGPILLQARTEPALGVSDSVYRVLSALPQAATTSISAGMMKGVDVAITNVPGPPIQLYVAGAGVEMFVPFAPKAGAAANVALLTYNGHAYVGLNIDVRAIPDPEVFAEHIAAGFQEVLDLGKAPGKVQIGVHESSDA